VPKSIKVVFCQVAALLQLRALVPRSFVDTHLDRHALIFERPIQAFLNDGLKKSLSSRTVQYHRTVLRIALGQAMKWGLVVRNVAALVDPPRAERFETKPICAEEARALLQSIQGDRLEALFTVALSLGLRRGEALGLGWEDIDFQSRTLRINAALQRIDHKLQ
jgi:integrase